jgi:hypothetical protein
MAQTQIEKMSARAEPEPVITMTAAKPNVALSIFRWPVLLAELFGYKAKGWSDVGVFLGGWLLLVGVVIFILVRRRK